VLTLLAQHGIADMLVGADSIQQRPGPYLLLPQTSVLCCSPVASAPAQCTCRCLLGWPVVLQKPATMRPRFGGLGMGLQGRMQKTQNMWALVHSLQAM